MKHKDLIKIAIDSQPKTASYQFDYLFKTVYEGMLEQVSLYISSAQVSLENKLQAQELFFSLKDSAHSEIRKFSSLSLDEKAKHFDLSHLMTVEHRFAVSESTITKIIASVPYLIYQNERARILNVADYGNVKEYLALTDKCRNEFHDKFKDELSSIYTLTKPESLPEVTEHIKHNKKKVRLKNV